MSKTPQTTETTPSPPPPGSRHVAMSTNMEVMACILGFFFLCAILCAAFRLLYLKRLESRRRNRLNRPVQFDFSGGEERGPAVDNPVWLINFVGLSQSAIDSIAIFKYKKGEGSIEGTECSVCLGEFEEDEDVRSLPKCGHAFHAPCIDTWLRSHKNCPLCRAPVVVVVGNVGETVRMETLVEGSEAEVVESESEVEARSRGDRVGEGGSGTEIDMGFGDVMLLEGEIGRNSKNCDFREIGGLVSERELDRSNRCGEGGSGTEIDMSFGDVMLIEGEIEGNSKNCDSREIKGLCNERGLDSENRGCRDCSGTEIDMGFGDVTLIEGNSKNYYSREIRGLGTQRDLDCHNWVDGDDSGAEIDMSFGDVTRIDDEIGRNWKICDFRAIGDLADKKMNLDHHNRVGEDGFGAKINLGFGSNAQMDDVIGRNSKKFDSPPFSDLVDKMMDLERRNSKNLLDFRASSDLATETRFVTIEPMKRSVSMGSNSSKLGKLKRNSFKNNGDGNRSSSLCRLIRSASLGRLSNRSSMKRYNSGSSGNFRSYDSILPL